MIITLNTIGLLNDAKICKRLLKNNNIKSKIVINDGQTITVNTKHVLFIERIIKFETTTNPIQIFLPNHELFRTFNKYELLSDIDIILCKTKISYDFFNSIKRNMKYKTFYIKFTTYIPKLLRIPESDIKKDKNLFTMFAGSSPFKNVAYVVKNWIENKGYQDLNPNVKLVISCRGLCFSSMIKNLKEYLKYKVPFETSDKIIYDNLELYNSHIEDDYYKYLIQSSYVALCPSSKEGYGHYINEARYFNTFVITIDSAPMNELINDKIGYLMKDYEEHVSDVFGYKLSTVYPNDADLTKAITYCINNDLHINSRTYFLDDRQYLKSVFKNEVAPEIKKLIM